MKIQQHIAIILALILSMIGGVQLVVPHAQVADLHITGRYALAHDGFSTLEISVEGTSYVVLLSGGRPAPGAAVPAACYVKAKGKLQGRLLVADFSPLETETFVYSKTQAEKEKRQLQLVFGMNTAEVIHAETFGYCGRGASFEGHYRRIQTPQ